ncbi:MAG: UvrD-helicase domain-containing protein [Firmicutes bacterium]|nr:UvrD-helicase domain-containing protein [Candidatus Colimorpha enterica]
MAEKNNERFTLSGEQKAVIRADEDDILVSASAGSGKTTVLTQRLAERVRTGRTKDLSRVLVVTFTKASASDLRVSIKKRLGEIAKYGEDELSIQGEELISDSELQTQLRKIDDMEVSTIDSFCYNFVKDNAVALGVSPSIRIFEDAQKDILQRQIAENVLNLCCDGRIDGIENVNPIINAVCGDDFSKGADNIIGLYGSLSSLEEGVDYLSHSVRMYEDAEKNGFENSEWAKIVIDECNNAYKASEEMLLRGEMTTVIEKKKSAKTFADYVGTVKAYLDVLKKAVKAGEYDRIVESTADFENALKGKRCASDLVKTARKIILDVIPPSVSSDNANAAAYAEICRGIYALVKEFDARYNYEKKKRGLEDFNGLKRLTFDALKKDEFRALMRSKYDEVYIDEYQDVDDVQAAIFDSMAKAGIKRFAVGDIKQSIYGFRYSNPQNFENLRRSAEKTLYLSSNYRSGEKILDFANRICGPLMRNGCNGFTYTDADDLRWGNKNIEKSETSVLLVDVVKSSFGEAIAGDMAKELAKKGKKPSDFCVLLRTDGSSSLCDQTVRQLGAHGITSYVTKRKVDLFKSPSVSLAISLLNVIDNPYREIELTAVLTSPIYGFTLADLITLKGKKKKDGEDVSLFEALLCYAGGGEIADKIRKFTSDYDKLKKLSSRPAHEVLWETYMVTGLYGFSGYDGGNESRKTSRERLNYLYDYARQYESREYKGLYSFVSYMNVLKESGCEFDVKSGGTEDAVTVSTMHGSKGLQYDTVYLYRKDSVGGKSPDIMFGKETGLLFKAEADNFASFTFCSIAERAYNITKKYAEAEEEMRLLYVALTRAKTKCVVVTDMKKGNKEHPDSLEREMAEADTALEQYGSLTSPEAKRWYLLNHGRYLDWMTTSFGNVGFIDENNVFSPEAAEAEKAVSDGKRADEVRALIEERIKPFEYSGGAAGEISAKYSVSHLKPVVLDEDDGSEDLEKGDPEKAKAPAFIEERKDKASDRGTATHSFMQFADLGNLRENGYEAERDRLVGLGFITEKSAELVNRKGVIGFASSDVADAILSSVWVKREMRFNVRLPAAEFTSDPDKKALLQDEKVLVQGVIDLLYRDVDGKLVLLDYKTDAKPRDMSEGDFEMLLRERHGTQMKYYGLAVEKIKGEKPARTVIWSFALGRTVPAD